MNEEIPSETAEGSVYLEIAFKLTSESGREKHVDIEGQGKFMADAIQDFLISITKDAVDITIKEVKYWGTKLPK